MRMLTSVFMLLVATLVAGHSVARETVNNHPILQAMSHPEFDNKVGNAIKFYFGDQATPPIEKRGSTYNTTRKTQAVGRTDSEACDWAFLSALIVLRDKALEEGGNAVINIKSSYKGGAFSSQDEYRCGAGNLMAGVSLQGTTATVH